MKAPSPILSQLLSGVQTRHGFFTRRGGVSKSIYASLNCAYASNDYARHVRENRAAVSAQLGLEESSLISLRQAHTNKVWTVSAPWAGSVPVGDALVSKTPGIALAVLGADCAPVLFAHNEAKVIGACHAGWKGALNGIVPNTVDAMVKLGAKRDGIVACIGPAIAQASYQVGAEFKARFMEHERSYGTFFENAGAGKHFFDLPRFIEHQLQHQAGIPSFERLAHDTYADEEQFFSYRRSTKRSESDYGRQISAITLAVGAPCTT